MKKICRVDVTDILTEYLTDKGYHGLFNHEGECACLINDLGACENLYQNCTAGWLSPCDCGQHDWHISIDHGPKEEAKKQEKRGEGMATVRDSMEIVGPGCQLLVNQQDETVVISVEIWDDEDDRRLYRRLEMDPTQADRLSGFFAAAALKAQKYLQAQNKLYEAREEEEAMEREELKEHAGVDSIEGYDHLPSPVGFMKKDF